MAIADLRPVRPARARRGRALQPLGSIGMSSIDLTTSEPISSRSTEGRRARRAAGPRVGRSESAHLRRRFEHLEMNESTGSAEAAIFGLVTHK